MEASNRIIMDKAIIDTANKHGWEQNCYALHAYLTKGISKGFTGINKQSVKNIPDYEVKEMIVSGILEGMLFKKNNHMTRTLSVLEKQYKDLSSEELQFVLYDLYQKGGIESVDTWIDLNCLNGVAKTEDIKFNYLNDNIFKKLAYQFIEDRYRNNYMKDGQLDRFVQNDLEAKALFDDVSNFYQNYKSKDTSNKLY